MWYALAGLVLYLALALVIERRRRRAVRIVFDFGPPEPQGVVS